MELVYNLALKTLFFSFLFFAVTLYAGSLQEHTRLSYDQTISLLKGIQKDAIVLGTGKREVYVFIDPYCPHSRKFITMVSQNAAMLSKYTYYLYLYSIPRLKSEAMVSAIYASKKPLDTLLRVMVNKEKFEPETLESTRETVADIASVAKKIDVYKRPYLIVAIQK